jgi:hypothetical protein
MMRLRRRMVAIVLTGACVGLVSRRLHQCTVGDSDNHDEHKNDAERWDA